MKYAFLGPLGTFCHQAVSQLIELDTHSRGDTTETTNPVSPVDMSSRYELLPYAGERLAMDSVRQGVADRAVVPIENTVEGGVSATMDSLARDKRLMIMRETCVPVAFTLAIAPGTDPATITHIGTHPHAWAQCRNWMSTHMPTVYHVRTASTAHAAQLLGQSCRDTHTPDNNLDTSSDRETSSRGDTLQDVERAQTPGFQAVLCSRIAATMNGLTILYDDVADNPGAFTRFVELAIPQHLPTVTGHDRTTIQVYPPTDSPGSLMTMLEQFSVRGVNLTRIESRPVAGQPGRYSFNIDIDGHIAEERVQAALVGLYRTCDDIRFLGSYPKADGRKNVIETSCSDGDFSDARAWVNSILGV